MPLLPCVALLLAIFFSYPTPAYAGRTETETREGLVVVWTVDYPQYDRAKGNAREFLKARKKFDSDLELCKQISDRVDRDDCLTGKDCDGSGYAFQGHRSRLRTACGAALRGDKTTMIECIVGADKLGQSVAQHYTSFRSVLAVSKGCRGFIEKLGEAYTRSLKVRLTRIGSPASLPLPSGEGWGEG